MAKTSKPGASGKKPTQSPSTEKVSGLGPAIAEHSKDAKVPKGGRTKPYVKT